MATLVEDITKALINLGGQGSLNQIYKEIAKIQNSPLPVSWQGIVRKIIARCSSDSDLFAHGRDLFRKVDTDIWALRENTEYKKSNSPNIAAEVTKSISYKNHGIPDSFEEIQTILKTIKQYRDYQSPDSHDWKDYVVEFFHILGFSLEQVDPRLYLLSVMGTNNSPKAILEFVHPNENFEEIAPGLLSESYLFYAANYFRIGTGIITNGLQLKLVKTTINTPEIISYWKNLDGIITNEQLDTFFEIFRAFTMIKGGTEIKVDHTPNTIPIARNNFEPKAIIKEKIKPKPNSVKIIVEDPNNPRSVFWKQLVEKGENHGLIFGDVSANAFNWLRIASSRRGITYDCGLHPDTAEVQLYINLGNFSLNNRFYNACLQEKELIEIGFGGPLDWQRLEHKSVCLIKCDISGSGYDDKEKWDVLQNKIIDVIRRMQNVFNPFINRVNNLGEYV